MYAKGEHMVGGLGRCTQVPPGQRARGKEEVFGLLLAPYQNVGFLVRLCPLRYFEQL